MSINLWDRTASVVRARFRSSALAQYGAGLHTECEDCAVAPDDVVVPPQRRDVSVEERQEARAR